MLGPLVQGQVPGQRHDRGVGPARDDAQAARGRPCRGSGQPPCQARLVAAPSASRPTLVRFRPGTEITRREVLHGRLWLTHPVTVVADDGEVLAVLLEPGSAFTFHEHPFGPHPWRRFAAWGGTTVLQLHREGDAYSVWKFFDDGRVPPLVRELRGARRPARRRLRHRRPRTGPHRPPRRPARVEGRRATSPSW